MSVSDCYNLNLYVAHILSSHTNNVGNDFLLFRYLRTTPRYDKYLRIVISMDVLSSLEY